MNSLFSGMLATGYLIAGLHFLKFQQRTGDRLFLIFAVAFWMLAAQRLALIAFADQADATVYLYLLRLIAFLLIIGAIIDKNRAVSSPQLP